MIKKLKWWERILIPIVTMTLLPLFFIAAYLLLVIVSIYVAIVGQYQAENKNEN